MFYAHIINFYSALGYMRRVLALVREYSKVRTAWGKPLKDLPLYSEVLFRMVSIFILFNSLGNCL